MYTIYHFFAYLLHRRRGFHYVRKFVDYQFDERPLSYKGNAEFPTLALRMNPGGDPPGGELIGLKPSRSYSIPTFRSHIPAGLMSISSLRHDKANEIFKSMKAAGEEAESMPIREVYYLILGKRLCYTKVCLVHGSFFETVKAEQVVRLALVQALSDCMDEDKRTINAELMDLLTSVMAKEVFSHQLRHVKNASVAFRLEVDTDVIKKANILDPDYFPGIRDDTISIVVPYRIDEDFRERRRHLKSALTKEEWTAGRKMVMKHPMNGKFFVLSYAL